MLIFQTPGAIRTGKIIITDKMIAKCIAVKVKGFQARAVNDPDTPTIQMYIETNKGLDSIEFEVWNGDIDKYMGQIENAIKNIGLKEECKDIFDSLNKEKVD